MMKRTLVAVTVAFATITVSAQTTMGVLPLPESWGAVEVERFIETDGNPDTTEVLIWRYVDYQWRIVAVRPDGALCAGPWFAFIDNPWLWPRIMRVGDVDVAFLTETAYQPQARSYYFKVALVHPTVCLP